MAEAHKIFSDHRPRKGSPISYEGKVFRAHHTEGNLCYVEREDGNIELGFIWCFSDGLNALHDWPEKAGGRVTFCPRPDLGE